MKTESEMRETGCGMRDGIPDGGSSMASRGAAARSATVLAALDYESHGCLKKFWQDLWEHHESGYVISSPDLFAMFKAVLTHDGRTAWYVVYARGDLRALLAIIPFPLPWIAFRSHDRPIGRVWPFDRFVNLASRLSNRGARP